MGEPLTPDRMISILRAEGVRVAEYPGWRTRERDDETGKPFGAVHLLLNHHTAGTASLKTVAETGRPGLPAPLAHGHLNKTGLLTLTCSGRANHAGLMAKNAYDSFVDEKTFHPHPDKSTGTVDGNDVSYGWEVENLGDNDDVYPEVQYDALVRINAAFCREYGWTAGSVACHKETSVEGKVDPRGPVAGYGTRGPFVFTPSVLRQDVADRLAHPASWSPPQKEAPVPAEPVTSEGYRLIAETDAFPSPRNHPDHQMNPYWTLESYLRFIAEELIRQRSAS